VANRLAEYERAQSPPGAVWPQASPQDLQGRVNNWMQQASQWVVEHPEIALTTAVVAGVVMGWLIKRR